MKLPDWLAIRDFNQMQIQLITDDEVASVIPARFDVCPCCRGKGKTVNPAIDGHGISPEEFAEDPDFAEQYRNGLFDITCPECDGMRVQLVPTEDGANELRLHCRDYFEGLAATRAEQRMGA